MGRGVLFSPEPLHAPDGFFAPWLAILGWAVMVSLVALAIRHTRTQLGERQVPLMGILAATIFAGQMLNFTIPGGTSGHLLGGTLAAAILGPWGGTLVMTAVIVIQALVFQDGGLLAIGLNVINMGIITAFVGYFAYRLAGKIAPNRGGQLVGAFIGGWLSVIVTAGFTAVELALSGTSPLAVALPAMVGVHALIGIGEGLLTVFALSFIMATRPDLVGGEQAPGQTSAGWVTAGLIMALALTLLAPLASSYDDGLIRVANAFSTPESADQSPVGFAVPQERQWFGQEQASPYQILSGYNVPLLGDSGLSTILAGMIGVLVVFGVAYGAARVAKAGRRGSDATSQP